MYLNYAHDYMARHIDTFETLPPLDIEILRRDFERFIVVSAPMQQMLSNIRQTYRWTDPMHTARCLLIYIVAWTYTGIVPMMVSCHSSNC